MTNEWMIWYTLLSLPRDFGVTLVSVYLACVGLHLLTYVSARAVPQRGVKSVFYHVRRARDSLGKAGRWSAAEDEQLRM